MTTTQQAMHLSDPEFPPVYSGHPVKAPETPLPAAIAAIASGKAEAGHLFWARATENASCAIVLEPDRPLEVAMQAVPVAMVAVGDAVGAIAPPNVAVTYRWPGTILMNGARAGKIGAVLPVRPEAGGNVPWLVLTMDIAIRREGKTVEPGYRADETVLWEEGCGEIDRTRLLESFSRHLLAWMDSWEADGFGTVHEIWMFRAADRDEPVAINGKSGITNGTMIGIDDKGGLLVRTAQGVRGFSLADHALFMAGVQ